MNETEKKVVRNLFVNMSEEAVDDLLKVATIEEYPARHVLCRQGDYADTLYIMISGTVGVYVEAGDEMFQIDKIRHGSFGEIALILDRKRTAFIVTKEDTRVIELNRYDFARLATEVPEFGYEVAKLVIDRMIEQDTDAIRRLKPHIRARVADPTREILSDNKKITVEPIFGRPRASGQHFFDVFVIMPFRDDLHEVFDKHINKVVGSLNLTVKRGDDFFSDAHIMNDVWSAINESFLLIADCTGQNANVFYELGIAHTIGKRCIIITQNGNDIPFDIRQFRHIVYENSLSGMIEFEKQLKLAIKKILEIA